MNLWGAVNARLLDNVSVITLYNDDFTAANDAYTTAQSRRWMSRAGPAGQRREHLAGLGPLYAGPQHGTVTVNPDGSFRYVPTTGYSGADSFTYRVQRTVSGLFGTTDSFTTYGPTATVNLTVQALRMRRRSRPTMPTRPTRIRC